MVIETDVPNFLIPHHWMTTSLLNSGVMTASDVDLAL
jgi:hypothetical protein